MSRVFPPHTNLKLSSTQMRNMEGTYRNLARVASADFLKVATTALLILLHHGVMFFVMIVCPCGYKRPLSTECHRNRTARGSCLGVYFCHHFYSPLETHDQSMGAIPCSEGCLGSRFTTSLRSSSTYRHTIALALLRVWFVLRLSPSLMAHATAAHAAVSFA